MAAACTAGTGEEALRSITVTKATRHISHTASFRSPAGKVTHTPVACARTHG